MMDRQPESPMMAEMEAAILLLVDLAYIHDMNV